MYSLLLLFIVSFLACLILTPLCRNLSSTCGFTDRPDGGRKFHGAAVPRIGGVPIVLALLLAFTVLLLSPLKGRLVVVAEVQTLLRVLPAAAIVFGTGLMDDLFCLKPWHKLAGQVPAAVLAFSVGVRVRTVCGVHLPLWISLPVTVIWIVGCTNAFNLVDGVDGLAAGIGLLATATMLVSALMNHWIDLAMATVPLAGALLGFLLFNFTPASIFLGDCGSLSIGFVLGCYGIFWNDKSATVLGIAAPLMALSIPLLDTGLAIARRFLQHQPIFGADRQHIHHRLLDRGLTPRRAVLVLYTVCCIAAGLSVLQNVYQEQAGGFVLVTFCVCAMVGIRQLKYSEFGALGRFVTSGVIRRMLTSQIALTSFENLLNQARSADECWEHIRGSWRQFGCSGVEIQFGRYFWTDGMSDLQRGDTILKCLLRPSGYLVLWWDSATPAPLMIAAYAEVLSKTLQRRAAQLQLLEPAAHLSRMNAVAGAAK